MNHSEDFAARLDTISKILIRCFAMGAVLMVIWFLFFWLLSDFVYGMHSRWFSISREQFNLIMYSGLVFTKTLILLAFLLPYISIRLVLKK